MTASEVSITTKPVVLALALSTLFFAILMPPEAYPAGKTAVILSSTFVFLIAATERKIPYVYLLNGVAIFPMLLIHSLWLSVDAYRSLEFMTVLWAYYCLLGFFLYAGFDSRVPFAASVVILSLIVSGYGLYQYFWGFDQLYNYVSNSGSGQAVKGSALARIATQRIFSTLTLPGTLWGFVLVALPIHAILWRRHRLLDIALVISAALLLTTGLLTRSFGFLAGLFVLIVAWLAIHHRRLFWNRLTAALVILLIAAGLFYSARRGATDEANPVSLRFKNWVSAWNIFAVNAFGTGLNTYGIVYPQYMQPGANETQYVHNTPLQIISELGYPSILAAMALVLFLVQTRKPSELDSTNKNLVIALMVWILHNLIDINVYFPSVGVLGVVLIGVLLSRRQQRFEISSKVVPVGIFILAVSVMVFSASVLLSSELQHRAQIEYGNTGPLVALQTLQQARSISPLNSSLFHDSGQIELELFHKLKDPKHLQSATESFSSAIDLSPLRFDAHIGLGLCLSTSNELVPALEQIRIAQRLYPSSDYVRSIARLMEQRIYGGK